MTLAHLFLINRAGKLTHIVLIEAPCIGSSVSFNLGNDFGNAENFRRNGIRRTLSRIGVSQKNGRRNEETKKRLKKIIEHWNDHYTVSSRHTRMMIVDFREEEKRKLE